MGDEILSSDLSGSGHGLLQLVQELFSKPDQHMVEQLVAFLILESKTELLTCGEIAGLLDCGINYVATEIVPRYKPEKIGQRYRMPVKEMPPEYLLRVIDRVVRKEATVRPK